jgi:hypothetical protein
MLHLAYRLGLDELRAKLHAFILANTMFRSSLLTRPLLTSAVFSERVMAAVDRRALRDAWVDSIVYGAGDVARDGGLFEVSSISAGGVVAADVALRRPFMGSPAGTRVKLDVDLRTGQMCRDDGEVCMVGADVGSPQGGILVRAGFEV